MKFYMTAIKIFEILNKSAWGTVAVQRSLRAKLAFKIMIEHTPVLIKSALADEK